MITPKPLFSGARVALICPSSAVPEGRLEPSLAAVRALGLEPVVYPSCYYKNRHGDLAAPDAQRAAELRHAFEDETIDGVFALRGGYGAQRLLPLLDFVRIGKHPKWFGGYSDVTALHTALHQLCGIVTYHCPMPSTEYYQPIDDYTMASLRRALFSAPGGRLSNPDGVAFEPIAPGRAEGVLCGGNLTVLTASLGTPWEIDTRGKILFLEDIDEKFYRIDRMLTQLRNAGKLDACAGVLLGAWTDCTPGNPDAHLTLREIVEELIAPSGIPVMGNLACGHTLPTMTLPLGATVRMDARAGSLEVLA